MALSCVAAEPQHSNILFLFADDQRYDNLSCTRHLIVDTPTIGRFAVKVI